MENKTAVEWLFEKMAQTSITDWYKVREEAISMEKEQIKDAYWNGTTNMEKQDALNDAEKFYNEYYTKNNR